MGISTLEELENAKYHGQNHLIIAHEEKISTGLYGNSGRLLLIHALFELGRFYEAFEQLQEVEQNFDDPADYYEKEILRVKVNARMGKLEEGQQIASEIEEGVKSFESSHIFHKKFIYARGLLIFFSGRPQESLEIASDALEMVYDSDDKLDIAEKVKLLNLKSFCFSYLGKGIKAEKVASEAIDLAINLNHQYLHAYSMIMLGNAYEQQTLFDKAANIYEQTIILSEKSGFVLGLVASHGNLGDILRNKGQYSKSIGHIQESKKISIESNDKRNLAFSYDTLGDMYVSQGNLEIALENKKKALELHKFFQNNINVALSMQSIALIHRMMENYTLAQEIIVKSLELLDETSNANFHSKSLLILILVYYDLGEREQVKSVLTQLEAIDNIDNIAIIGLRNKYSKGLYYKMSKRPRDIFQAYDIFQNIANDELIDIDIMIASLFALCELQFYEIDMVEEEESTIILDNIRKNIGRLMKIADDHNNMIAHLRALILQSKIALIDDPVRSNEYVLQAEKIMHENKLHGFALTISMQKELIQQELEGWENRDMESVKNQVKRLNLDQYIQLLSQQREETNMFLHDISNLLQINMNYANFLAYDKELSEPTAEYVRSIERTGIRIQNLVESLKQIISLDQHSYPILYEKFDVSQMLDRLTSDYKIGLDTKKIQVHSEYPEHANPISICIELTERIIDNLLSNAVKYTPEGGEISIYLKIEYDQWQFVISNSGPIIGKGEQERLFDKFYRSKHHIGNRERGTGLGLAFCKSAIQALDGEIHIISPRPQYDDGVCFEIVLPIKTTYE